MKLPRIVPRIANGTSDRDFAGKPRGLAPQGKKKKRKKKKDPRDAYSCSDNICFDPGWDDDNDLGSYNQKKVVDLIYAAAENDEDLDDAIHCKMLLVKKGCHQGNDPHVTVRGLKKLSSTMRKCARSRFYESGVHIPC